MPPTYWTRPPAPLQKALCRGQQTPPWRPSCGWLWLTYSSMRRRQSAQAIAFFRRNPAPATFSVPLSEEYLKELHAFWRDTRALSHSHRMPGPWLPCRMRHSLPSPPQPQAAWVAGARPTGLVVGCFSHQQLSYWAACTWVVSTLTQGYELQFRRRPLAFSRVKMTVVNDPAKALALDQELSTLLAKGAIEPVDALLHPRGFYSRFFLIKKKDGSFRPILDLRGLNRFLKVLPFHMRIRHAAGGHKGRVVHHGGPEGRILPRPNCTAPSAPPSVRLSRPSFSIQGTSLWSLPLPEGIQQGGGGSSRTPAEAGHEGPAVFGRLADLCTSQSQVARDTARLLLHVV
ncbi:uncharacterized protein LOC132475134 [Gadus macrocephalus]|uniref:uncharacterized protein LOC132475134 n=1 Tax=Gadus macrocephalus TaxID=80720 RepID=UPI0028CBB616|nr:uncharacterized protein LOC132475134 [Gadus macrocephalus]